MSVANSLKQKLLTTFPPCANEIQMPIKNYDFRLKYQILKCTAIRTKETHRLGLNG